jgi:hypothetical protein
MFCDVSGMVPRMIGVEKYILNGRWNCYKRWKWVGEGNHEILIPLYALVMPWEL